jgi:outer membrane protein OmpA-like peptidoglycan-associated protein
MSTPEYFQAEASKQERWLVSYVDVITILLVLFVTAAAHGIQKLPVVAPALPRPEPPLASTRERLKRQGIDFEIGTRGLAISLPQAVLYSTGEDDINSSALPMISGIAGVLLEILNKVVLVGHADASPIRGGRFRDNWELSAARSLRLLELLTQQYGLPEARLSIAGQGPYSPKGSNETAAGRAANRRVEILILNDEIVSAR